MLKGDMLKKLTIDGNAKINLSLDVIRRREDGYHDLSMIMQEITLNDVIELEEIERDEIRVSCTNEKVPTDASNIVYRIAYTIKEKFKIKKGISINIIKNIPLAAGLAGGSADGAATLKGLNELWNLELSEQELIEIAKPIGADIPFCVVGGTALAEGIGEKLTKIRGLGAVDILLVYPEVEVSTAYVYKNLKLDEIEKRPDNSDLIEAIERGDINHLAKNMVNVLESVTSSRYSIIEEIKKSMIENGALGSMMSGSGPTVFGIFESETSLERCAKELKKKYKVVIKAKTVEAR